MNILNFDFWQFLRQRSVLQSTEKYLHILIFIILGLAGILLTWLSGKPWLTGLPIFVLGPLTGLFIIRDYRWGIFLILMLLPVNEYQDYGFGKFKFALQMSVLMIWFINKLLKKNKLLNYIKHPITLIAGGALALAGINILVSSDYQISTISFLRLIGNLMFYFVFIDLLREKSNIYWLFAALFIGAAGEAVYGIVQYLTVFNNASDSYFRSFGTFNHSNIYARYLGVVLMMVIAMRTAVSKVGIRWGLALLAAVLTAGIIVSLCRSVMLGLVLGISFIIIVNKKPAWGRIIIAGLVILFIGYYTFFISWLVHETPKSVPVVTEYHYDSESGEQNVNRWKFSLMRNIERKNYWLTAMELIIKKPIFGHGLDVIHSISDRTISDERLYYVLERAKKSGALDPLLMLHPHNLVLDIVLDMGLIGLVLITGLYSRLLKKTLMGLKRINSRRIRLLIIAGGAVVLYDMIVGLAEPAGLFCANQVGLLFVFATSFIFIETSERSGDGKKYYSRT